MDRFDVLAAVGVLAIVAGLFAVHPAWLLVAAGYVAVNRSTGRPS